MPTHPEWGEHGTVLARTERGRPVEVTVGTWTSDTGSGMFVQVDDGNCVYLDVADADYFAGLVLSTLSSLDDSATWTATALAARIDAL